MQILYNGCLVLACNRLGSNGMTCTFIKCYDILTGIKIFTDDSLIGNFVKKLDTLVKHVVKFNFTIHPVSGVIF